jgi:hypothetical protein
MDNEKPTTPSDQKVWDKPRPQVTNKKRYGLWISRPVLTSVARGSIEWASSSGWCGSPAF